MKEAAKLPSFGAQKRKVAPEWDVLLPHGAQFWELDPAQSPGWYKRAHFPPQCVRHEAMHDGVSWVDLDVPN